MRGWISGRGCVAGAMLVVAMGSASGAMAAGKSRHAHAQTALATSGGILAEVSGGMSGAEKLRRLDIMLMVTSLRCRDTLDDFQLEFSNFEANHTGDLKVANRQLQADFIRKYGAGGAAKQMDHIKVEMANTYGNGHPWMGCHDLKSMTHDMALMRGPAPVLTVADQLLGAPKIVAQPQ